MAGKKNIFRFPAPRSRIKGAMLFFAGAIVVGALLPVSPVMMSSKYRIYYFIATVTLSGLGVASGLWLLGVRWVLDCTHSHFRLAQCCFFIEVAVRDIHFDDLSLVDVEVTDDGLNTRITCHHPDGRREIIYENYVPYAKRTELYTHLLMSLSGPKLSIYDAQYNRRARGVEA